MAIDQDVRPVESSDSPAGVLAEVRATTCQLRSLEVRTLELALEWASMHPAESIDHAAGFDLPGSERPVLVAGPGAPLVAEFCIAELALALGLSTDAGRYLLGEALELRYRLPEIWAQVRAGRVPVSKARRVARDTTGLSLEAAAYLDRQLAPQLGRCSWSQIDRTIEFARDQLDPAAAAERRRARLESRHFEIDRAQISFDGTMLLSGELDLADALDLDQAISAIAARLGELGSNEPLDVRRSMAAGMLARGETPEGPGPAREVLLHVHTTPEDLADPGLGTGFVEGPGHRVAIEQIRDWCSSAGTRVSVRPVIDLNHPLRTDAYRPTATQRDQAALINPTCVFVRCTRPARGCDVEHQQAYADGGATETANLAPTCRRHHRLKTHGGWQVQRTGPTTFTWTSPHGYRYDWDTSHVPGHDRHRDRHRH